MSERRLSDVPRIITCSGAAAGLLGTAGPLAGPLAGSLTGSLAGPIAGSPAGSLARSLAGFRCRIDSGELGYVQEQDKEGDERAERGHD